MMYSLSDDGNYEALRMREVVELERHHFQAAADLAEAIIGLHPGDPWSYGILGDASMEMGHYDRAAAAYQRMLILRPDQSSLNRASWYEFVSGTAPASHRADEAGHRVRRPLSGEHCLVPGGLGQSLLQDGRYRSGGPKLCASRPDFPGYHAAQAGLGRVRAARGNYADAIACLPQSAKLGADAGIRRRARAALHSLATAGGGAQAARI